MQTVGIKTLKDKLSAYLRAVGEGETIQVTDRGRVVAEIVPPRRAEATLDAESEWTAMIKEGVITPAKKRFDGAPPKVPFMTFEEIMADQEADREDR